MVPPEQLREGVAVPGGVCGKQFGISASGIVAEAAHESGR